MSHERKPWEIPVIYNEDRFDDRGPSAAGSGEDDLRRAANDFDPGDREERDARDIDELLSRPDEKEEREYECTDTTPIDYTKGPHDDAFGVDEKEFDQPDNIPIDYTRGPSEEEFGIEDDELPDAGQGGEFDEHEV